MAATCTEHLEDAAIQVDLALSCRDHARGKLPRMGLGNMDIDHRLVDPLVPEPRLEPTQLDKVLDGVLNHVPPPAAFVARGVPMELNMFIARATEKERDDRFGSVGEMLEALHRIGDGTFPIACPVTLAKRIVTGVGHTIDKHPKVTALLVVLAVLGVVGLMVLELIHAVLA